MTVRWTLGLADRMRFGALSLLVLLAAAPWAFAQSSGGGAAPSPAAPVPSVRLPGHVLNLLRESRELTPAQIVAQPEAAALTEKPLLLTVTLNRTDPAGFETYAAGVAAGRNPPLSFTELASRFGPSGEAYQTVIHYLEGAGFNLVEGSRNRLSVTVQGNRARAEKAFAIRIRTYQLNGRTFFANDADPAVPSNVAPLIHSIAGLNNLAVPRPLGAPNPALPLSIATAYGRSGLPFGITGRGQTVAIVLWDNYDRKDVAQWLAFAGLPPSTLNQLDSVMAGGADDISGDPTEALIDITTVMGVAPNANVITVIAGKNISLQAALGLAWSQVTGDSGRGGIISISYTTCEREFSDSDADSLQLYARSMTATGTSLFAASGDNGATCVAGDDDKTRYANRIGYPAGLSDAVGVGGTTLQVNGGNTYSGESWWTAGDNGGGFGSSWHFPRPGYQTPWTATTGKSVPDVSADADPTTGITVCKVGVCNSGFGGTSVATPIWAGIWALACDARAQGPEGACPAAQGGYLYSLNPSAFKPPSSMTGPGNDFAHLGLGSPNIPALVAQVAGRPVVASLAPAAGPVTGGTTVTVSGFNFIGVTSVLFENAGTATVGIGSSGELTAISPALTNFNITGPKHVIVTTAAGDSDRNDASVFTYKPLVTGVSPSSGPIGGGTAVTITGFNMGTQIAFGGVSSPNVKCDSDTQCVAASPPGSPGTVDVTVGGSDPNDHDKFSYETPSIARVEPKVGPESGGIYVSIYGSSFPTGIGVDPSLMSVDFCPVSGACKSSPLVECSTSTWCLVFVPPGTGTVDIVTRTGSGVTSPRTDADRFTYAPFPTIAGLSPISGPATGGTPVSITGTNFAVGASATKFNFGETGSADGECDSTTHCLVTAPSGTGSVYLTATVGDATGFRNTAAAFAYVPVVQGVSPQSGAATGGTTVTITGAGFIDRDAFGNVQAGTVAFGATPASGFCTIASSCQVVSPAGSGTVDVSVTAGEEASSPNPPVDQFSYDEAGSPKAWTKWNFPSMPGPIDTLAYDAARNLVVGLGSWVVNTSVNNCPPPEELPPGSHCTPPPPKFVQVTLTATWGVDGGGWAQLSPPDQPHPAAVGRSMGFHAASGKVVLFGGQSVVGMGAAGQPSNATWLWDGTTWTDANPPASPPPRFGASMAYDAARQVLVLFGGCGAPGCTTRLNDTWTWDGSTWQQQSPVQSPPARARASFAFLSGAGRAVLFGGEDATGFRGDTWEWDGTTWTQRSTTTSPSPRRDAPMVETPSGLLLFGGSVPGLPPAETWAYDSSGWTQLHPAASPSASGPMAFDPDKQEAVCLCAGSETWTWGGE
jgi:hypothetical protein